MTQTRVILPTMVAVLALASLAQAGTISVFLSSGKPILHSMDLTMNRGSFTYLYTQGQSRIESIYKNQKPPDTLRLKNPNIALLIAILPGSVVHGAGHFYAGKPLTGVALLGLEIIGTGLVFFGAVEGLGEAMEGGSKGNPEGTMLIGLSLFLFSWIYDIIGVPLTIARENERILQKQAGRLGLNLRI